MDRRDFVALGAATVAGAPLLRARPTLERTALWRPPELAPTNLVLRANAHAIPSGPGTTGTAMTLGDGPIGPTLRMRTGDTATIRLQNDLAEATILHWHGLRVPEVADGHPRLAIAPGAHYDYRFEVIDRAGTYWYHAHPHHRTGEQVYRGMTGLLLVEDDAERALELPSGAREIAVQVADRRVDDNGEFVFDPMGHERMEGTFGNVAFANGTRDAVIDVDTALHRLRVVNITASRITRLALSNGAPMTLIGVDGGLLPAPVRVDHVDLATGERADLLVDFSTVPVGETVTLRSIAFTPPYQRGMGMGGMGMGGMRGGEGGAQGAALDLLAFRIARAVRERPWVARPFPMIAPLDPATAVTTREFNFVSRMMTHSINGREFDMDRIEVTVKHGTTEIWRFINPSMFPHPVHMHEAQFQVLSRTGGRAQRFPWERGWKDTVLVHPDETVDVIVHFDAHRGRYLMHCHNLVHEDMGMMWNYEIA
jgi:FtsP/CotA-like multicopper oxidase with cupredoxin domain